MAVNATGDVPAGRESGALVAVGQQLLSYAGLSNSGGNGWTYYSDLALYDPSKDRWTTVTVDESTTPAARASFQYGGAAVVGCSVFFYGGYTDSHPYHFSELIRYEADPAVTQCGVATGTCNKQCDEIVVDVQEIRSETNITLKFKLRHPDKV